MKQMLDNPCGFGYKESSISRSQLKQVYVRFSAANLSELEYGFVTAAEQYLLTLNSARDIIDEVVRCKTYRIRLRAEDLLKHEKA